MGVEAKTVVTCDWCSHSADIDKSEDKFWRFRVDLITSDFAIRSASDSVALCGACKNKAMKGDLCSK